MNITPLPVLYTIMMYIVKFSSYIVLVLLSLKPLFGGGDPLFFPNPPAAVAPPPDFISALCSMHICLVIFFLRSAISSTKFNKAAKILCHSRA